MKIKKGDHVRFLNSAGGGIVQRLEGKVAWVENEDGFEIPSPVHELVVVASDDTFIPAYRSPLEQKKQTQPQEAYTQSQPKANAKAMEQKRKDELPLLHTELAGNDQLSVYLAFLPVDEKALGSSPYECYLINDSNYCLTYSYASKQNKSLTHLASGYIEPNTRLFVEEFAPSELGEREQLLIQLIAYKEQRSYSYKEPLSVELKLDTVKFFKLHCFKENDFFEDNAIVYPLVEKDRSESAYKIKPEQIAEALLTKKEDPRATKTKARQEPTTPAIVEVDLHAHELLETTAGMSNAEILNYQLDKFHEQMAIYEGCKGQKIVFIHGKGEGVLRTAIEKELRSRYKKHSFQDASFREYGFGATMVIIH